MSRFRDCINPFQLQSSQSRQIKVQNYSFHFGMECSIAARSLRSLAAHKTLKLCCIFEHVLNTWTSEKKIASSDGAFRLAWGWRARRISERPMWASTEIPIVVQFSKHHTHTHTRAHAHGCHPKRRTRQFLFTFCFTSPRRRQRWDGDGEKREVWIPARRRRQQQKAHWWTEEENS